MEGIKERTTRNKNGAAVVVAKNYITKKREKRKGLQQQYSKRQKR
jgi:hypothetical protein